MIRTLVDDYRYIHLGIGLFGNAMFVAGSVLFLERFSQWHHLAVWLFILGSAGMFVGAMGKAAKDIHEAEEEPS